MTVGDNALINRDYFDCIDTSEKAYWIGFICADGYIRINNNQRLINGRYYNRNEKCLTIHISEKDLCILESLANTFELKVRHRHDVGSIVLSVYSLNFENLLKWKNDPLSVFDDIDASLYRHFIRGFFDGDGSAYPMKGTSKVGFNFASVNIDFLERIHKIINTESGISKGGGIYKHKKTKTDFYMLIYNGRVMACKFRDWIYNDTEIFLNRKYSVLAEAGESEYEYHPVCSRCGGDTQKNGFTPGKQRKQKFKCKMCNFQFMEGLL